MAAPPGERHGRSKLTNRDVLEMRAAYRRARPGTSYLSLALLYDVEPSTVGAVVRGVTWRHLLPKGAHMAVLDKWQQREAQQLADTEEITYEHAVKRLFPDVVAEPEVAEPETPAPKVSTVKSASK